MPVNLSWTHNPNAETYVVKRGTNVPGGPYGTLATGLVGTTFQDSAVSNGVTYYYVVAGVGTGAVGSGDSPEVPKTVVAAYEQVPADQMQLWLNSDYYLTDDGFGDIIRWDSYAPILSSYGTQTDPGLAPYLQTDWFDDGFSNIFFGNGQFTGDLTIWMEVKNVTMGTPPFTILCGSVANYGQDYPGCVLDFNGANLYNTLDPAFGAGTTNDWGMRTGSGAGEVLVASGTPVDLTNNVCVIVCRGTNDIDFYWNNPSLNDRIMMVNKGSGAPLNNTGTYILGGFNGTHGVRSTYSEIMAWNRALIPLEVEKCFAWTTNMHRLDAL